MLTREDNELLTQTGPGTPMGEFFRRFWMPVLLSEELPTPDCSPVRVKVLSEHLVAFRDTDGRVGVADNYCPHRRASLFFGRNEECGLRCVYHGWKFDVNGDCVDMPSEPAESNFKDKVKIKAYPAREYGSCVWVYMGPPALQPELPGFEWARVPDDHRVVTRFIQHSNYMQCTEGEIDSCHVSFLHSVFDLSIDYHRDMRTGNQQDGAQFGAVLQVRRAEADGEGDRLRPHVRLAPGPGGRELLLARDPVDAPDVQSDPRPRMAPRRARLGARRR